MPSDLVSEIGDVIRERQQLNAQVEAWRQARARGENHYVLNVNGQFKKVHFDP